MSVGDMEMTANTESSSNAGESLKVDSQQRKHSGSNSVHSNYSSNRADKKSTSSSPKKRLQKGTLSTVSSLGVYGASSISLSLIHI